MTALEILKAARTKIERPECWGRLWMKNGDRYCLLGAINAANPGNIEYRADDPVYSALLRATGAEPGNIGDWNDTHSHAEVIAALDRAIAELS